MTSFHVLEKKTFHQDVISLVWGNRDPADMDHWELSKPESFVLGRPALCLLSSAQWKQLKARPFGTLVNGNRRHDI